jgi:hypothetical protein
MIIEITTMMLFKSEQFLNCLYGIEVVDVPAQFPHAFLNCLYGIEVVGMGVGMMVGFLNCLYGIEVEFYLNSALL